MLKRGLLLVFVWVLFCFQASAASCGNGRCEPGETPQSCPQDCGPVSVNVDAGQSLGEIPEVFRAGILSQVYNEFDYVKHQLKDFANKPVWRVSNVDFSNSPGAYRLTKPANFESDFVEWLTTDINPRLKKYQEEGSMVIIALARMARWLALYTSNERMPNSFAFWDLKWKHSPPKDYAEYENLLKLFVSTLRNDGIDAAYIIGDEPNWMFYGTEEQYLKMVYHGVKAIKEVDASIQVGAPGAGNWPVKKDLNCPAAATGLEDGVCPAKDHTMIEALIEYASRNNIPLDFIDWHFPSPWNIEQHVSETRKTLRENGLPEDLPLTIGEWVLANCNETESTEKASSYVIHLLKSLMDAGIARHTGTSLFDQEGWSDGCWENVGYFSFDGIIKPKWNSFKAIDRFIHESRRIKIENNDKDHVTALASQGQDKTKILLSNFVALKPFESALLAARKSLSDESMDFIKNCMSGDQARNQKLQEIFRQYLKSERTIEDLENLFVRHCGSFPDFLRNDFINSKQLALEVYAREKYLAENPREIELSVSNIPFSGNAILTTYIIDKDHANSCRYNQRTATDKSTDCGINGEIDRAVSKAREDSLNAAKDYLLSLGYSQSGVDKLINCLKDPSCNIITVVNNYCQTHTPEQCDKLKADLKESNELRKGLFYYGRYVTPTKTYTIPVYIDKINNLPEVSLEGSKQTKEITIGSDGSYQTTITMQPYSVVLVELSAGSGGGCIAGDVNCDGKVDIFDLVIVAQNFGKPDFDPRADVNHDGQVNIFDLVIVAQNFGKAY